MWQLVCVALSCDLAVAAAYSSFRRSADSAGRRQYQVQHGSCSYTFLLPEADGCRPPASAYAPSAVQRDAPLDYDDSVQRLQALESIMENNTQWLLKVGGRREGCCPHGRKGEKEKTGGGGREQGSRSLNELSAFLACAKAEGGRGRKVERII